MFSVTSLKVILFQWDYCILSSQDIECPSSEFSTMPCTVLLMPSITLSLAPLPTINMDHKVLLYLPTPAFWVSSLEIFNLFFRDKTFICISMTSQIFISFSNFLPELQSYIWISWWTFSWGCLAWPQTCLSKSQLIILPSHPTFTFPYGIIILLHKTWSHLWLLSSYIHRDLP